MNKTTTEQEVIGGSQYEEKSEEKSRAGTELCKERVQIGLALKKGTVVRKCTRQGRQREKYREENKMGRKKEKRKKEGKKEKREGEGLRERF